MGSMVVVPMSQKAAKAWIAQTHRHHRPSRGDVFRLGVQVDGVLVGVVQAGRPVARALQDGFTLEVTRVATNGFPNACSALYGRVRRIAREMGYRRLFTYTLPSEGGASLLAAGWLCEGPTAERDREWVRSEPG